MTVKREKWPLTGTRGIWGVLLAPLMLSSPDALALTTVREDHTIGPQTPLDNYEVQNGATLTVNGAATNDIRLLDGGGLVLNGATVTNSRGAAAVQVGSSGSAIIRGSLISSERQGISLLRSGDVGATAHVSDSNISGKSLGALISTNSELTLERSLLAGTGEGSVGVRLLGGTLNALDSQVSGAQEGILVVADTLPGEARINLQGTAVQGQDGAAILVGNDEGAGAKATINVSAGSTLTGSNGNLLEVRNASSATMTVDGSQLEGNVIVEQGSSADLSLTNGAGLKGQLENVGKLSIGARSTWTMVGDASVGDLTMSGGRVEFGGPQDYQRLTLESLSGSGTFVMDANLVTGQTDFLDVTGLATGEHSLLIGSSGTDPVEESQLQVVHTGGGDATFSLLGGPVDLGAFSYDLIQRGDDWYLDTTSKVISPGTRSVLALFNTAPTVWYGELSTLRSRMGELRMDDGKAGGWMRAYGNKFDVSASSGVAYQQVQRGFSLGADAPLPLGDGQWLLGILAGHSRSDLDLSKGTTAEVDSFYLGGYVTWLDKASGYYFDGVVKFNRFDNDSKVMMSDGKRSKGNYDSHGVGASVEFGRHLAFSDGYFIEPYTQWSAVHIQGKDYRLDNDMRAEGDATRSLLGKLGATVGRDIELGEGRLLQPYVRVAYAREFINNNRVQVNDNTFDNDLSGSRGELGAGVAVALTDRVQAHLDLDYSNGEHIEQPWGANLGLRYSW